MEHIARLEERIEMLEAVIQELQQPKLMYKRPNGKDYEKVTDFLDDVENRLKSIENVTEL